MTTNTPLLFKPLPSLVLLPDMCSGLAPKCWILSHADMPTSFALVSKATFDAAIEEEDNERISINHFLCFCTRNSEKGLYRVLLYNSPSLQKKKRKCNITQVAFKVNPHTYTCFT
jgi:hypothetical protein